MDEDMKSLNRMVRNLVSDPDIQTKIEARKETQIEDVKDFGLHLLRARVSRLNEILSGNVPETIIAHELELVFRAATLYCPESLGNILLKSIRDSICQLNGYCIECGALIQNKKGNSRYCGDCSQKLEEQAKILFSSGD